MPFRATGASVRGQSHVAHNKPNQDAFKVVHESGWTMIAVADGHGSEACPRSDRGARFGVEAVHRLMMEVHRVVDSSPDWQDRLNAYLARMPDEFIHFWEMLVSEDLAKDPLVGQTTNTFLAYGSTCVGTILAPSFSLFLQIGDGTAIAIDDRGNVVQVIEPQDYIPSHQTHSLCEKNAAHHLHWRLFLQPHPLSRPSFTMCATDGIVNSFGVNELFSVPLFWWEHAQKVDLIRLRADLIDWLYKVTSAGVGDDATLALCFLPSSAEETAS